MYSQGLGQHLPAGSAMGGRSRTNVLPHPPGEGSSLMGESVGYNRNVCGEKSIGTITTKKVKSTELKP